MANRSEKARAARKRKAAEAARKNLIDRVNLHGGEYVRFDAPRGWEESVIDAAELTAESTPEEITDAAINWAQDHGCYCDDEGY